MASPTERPTCGIAEDLWLAWHDLWLQPVVWLTAWWDAYAVPTSAHAWHARTLAQSQQLAVPTPIARGAEQDLFA